MSHSSFESILEKGFREFNIRQKLFESSDKILVAVSGGIDSVSLLHLFLNSPVQLGVVHCNFQLRGSDSDEDEFFVRNLCKLNNIDFHTSKFNTLQFASENKLSIQVAARELRYKFFEDIRQREGYNFIAVAHNSDDSIETFFINLLRGTGINGLTGIKPKTGKIIRPLLFASRELIESYVQQNNLLFRLDKSNLSNKYRRNKIRNELIPLLENVAPGVRNTVLETIQNLTGVAKIYTSWLKSVTGNIIDESGMDPVIHISLLKSVGFYEVILPEVLRKYGFSADISNNILQNLDGESGKIYLSPSYRIVKDRSILIITKRDPEPDECFYVDLGTTAIETPITLKISHHTIDADFQIPHEPEVACIAEDKLVFPLILRHWKEGDYFRPLGMDQMKKLSDFFINEKFSVLDKERVWLLLSEGKIIWICGHRIDDRFKITSSTSRIVRFEILE